MKTNSNNNYTFAITVIGILFFIFGFITWATSQLIPYLKIACQLTETQSTFVGSAFFAAYFFMAMPSAFVLNKTGFKVGMSVGLFVMAIGAILFIPAAQTRNFALFLSGQFIIGTGLALLQTAANPYVTILGPMNSAAKRISIMGICNKIAGIVAVYVLGYITLKDANAFQNKLSGMSGIELNNTLQELANRVIVPYWIIASAFLLLGIILLFINLPKVEEAPEDENNKIDKGHSSILQHRNLILGVIALFLYVGVEVISYDGFAAFGEDLGFELDKARKFASYTGYGLLVGYLLSILLIPKYLDQRIALKWASILSIILVILSVTTSGWTAVVCFALLGFSQSIMWPAIWPLAINQLGQFTKIGSAFLVMAIVGGAVLLPLVSHLKGYFEEPRLAYLFMVPCYAFILYYAVEGYRTRSKTHH